jgi:hypothetical protein
MFSHMGAIEIVWPLRYDLAGQTLATSPIDGHAPGLIMTPAMRAAKRRLPSHTFEGLSPSVCQISLFGTSRMKSPAFGRSDSCASRLWFTASDEEDFKIVRGLSALVNA